MLSILIGLVSIGLSMRGILCWKAEFLVMIKGFLPLCFFLGGAVAVVFGLSQLIGEPKGDAEKK